MIRAAAALLLLTAPAAAQRALPVAPPSRADSLLARGRLRAAEDELYRAADASPRAPQARGELGRYLASRARFVIADVLFAEALRFGGDTVSIAQALIAIAPFRPEVDRRRIPGMRLPRVEAAREAARLASRAESPLSVSGVVQVPVTFLRDGRALARFEVRGPGGTRTAVLDPSVQGLLVASAADSALAPRTFGAMGAGAPLLVPELFIGAQPLRGVEARVDSTVPAGEVRMGLDVLWFLRPVFDERNGTMTISAELRKAAPGALHLPFQLGFPGMLVVPVVGQAPVPLASPRGRALLQRSRWWWDGPLATIVIER